jgi:hypothetical protein
MSRSLYLTALETRILQGNLAEVYTTFEGMDYLNQNKFQESTNLPTRGHSLQLIKHTSYMHSHKFYFSYRIVKGPVTV